MAKADIRSILYSKNKSPLEFKYDSLIAPPLLSYITIEDIEKLHNIASSIKYASKIEKKYNAIDEIMRPRGFVKFHSGTNRIVYRPLESNLFITKIAIDRVGLKDNPAEYHNQFLLQPFITKVFEVSPCGTIGSFERVQPLTSRQEFASVAEDIFMLLNEFIIGEYVLEDIGTKYFMNWGIRTPGFGPVLLDFPYVYKLDGKKLYCNTLLAEQGYTPCGGVIDYDNGFNNLICTKCGKRYLATELKDESSTIKILSKGDDYNMKVQLCKGNEVILEKENSSDSILSLDDNSKNLPRSFRNETILNYSENVLGRVILASQPKNKNKGKNKTSNFMNNHGNESRTKVPVPREIEQEEVIEKLKQKEEIKEDKIYIIDSLDIEENNNDTHKESDTEENSNEEFSEETTPENIEIDDYVDEQSEVVQLDNSSMNTDLYINKQANQVLERYGLSEKDFDENNDSGEDIEEKYADLVSEYEDEATFQKIGKQTKTYY